MKKMILGLVLVCFFVGPAFGQEQKINREKLKTSPVQIYHLEDPEARDMEGDDSQSPIYLLSVVQPEMLQGAPRGELKTAPPLPVAAKKISPKGKKTKNKKEQITHKR